MPTQVLVPSLSDELSHKFFHASSVFQACYPKQCNQINVTFHLNGRSHSSIKQKKRTFKAVERKNKQTNKKDSAYSAHQQSRHSQLYPNEIPILLRELHRETSYKDCETAVLSQNQR